MTTPTTPHRQQQRARYLPTSALRERRVTVLWTEDEYAVIHAAATAERITVSALLRRLVDEAIAHRQQQSGPATEQR